MKYCRKCGAKIKDTALFCNKCGTECSKRIMAQSDLEDVIEQKASETKTAVEDTVKKSATDVAAFMKKTASQVTDKAKDISEKAANTAEQVISDAEDVADKAKQGTNKTGIIIAIVAAILVVIAVVVFVVIKPGKSTKSSTEDSMAAVETEALTEPQAIAKDQSQDAPDKTEIIETEKAKEAKKEEAAEKSTEATSQPALPQTPAFEGSWLDYGGRNGIQIVKNGSKYSASYHGSGSAYDGLDETMTCNLVNDILEYNDGTSTRYV